MSPVTQAHPSPPQVIAPMFQELWRLLLQSPYGPFWVMTPQSSGPVLMGSQHFVKEEGCSSHSAQKRLPLSLSGDDVQGCILDHSLETQWLSPERHVLCLCYKIPKGELYMARKWITVHISLGKTCMFAHHQWSTETTFERATEAQIHRL